MPLLFAAAPALVPCLSVPPCVPSSSCRLSSLARQHPPSPAVVVAAAAAAADGGRRARKIIAVRRRPRRPAAVRAFAVARFSVRDRSCRHCRRRRRDGDRIPSFGAATIIVATKPSSPPPPPISSSSLSCLRQSAVTATISCLADTFVIYHN